MDRNILCKSDGANETRCPNIVDIWGRSSDSRYWRFVGDAFTTIEYKNVSQRTAEEFNKVIDSLCIDLH
jgi:hypothetical protein